MQYDLLLTGRKHIQTFHLIVILFTLAIYLAALSKCNVSLGQEFTANSEYCFINSNFYTWVRMVHICLIWAEVRAAILENPLSTGYDGIFTDVAIRINT